MDNKFKIWLNTISQTQKIICFCATSIALFFIACPIARGASNGIRDYWNSTLYLNDAFALEYTWYVWLVYIIIIGIIGFILFSKPSKNNDE